MGLQDPGVDHAEPWKLPAHKAYVSSTNLSDRGRACDVGREALKA